MKFLQILTFYPVYLNHFYNSRPGLAQQPYEIQLEALFQDGFGASHVFAPYLKGAGYDSRMLIVNCEPLQRQWLAEQGELAMAQRPDLTVHEVAAKQVEAFRPDIFYTSDPILFDSGFVRALSYRPAMVFGWRASSVPEETDWSEFDLIISNFEFSLELAKKRGARATRFFMPGFPPHVAKVVAAEEKRYDVVFTGQVSEAHHRRRAVLNELCAAAGRGNFSLDCFIPEPLEGFAPGIVQHNHGAVWGMDMFRTLRRGRIALNVQCDMGSEQAGNMRLFEAAGSGSFLLTDYQANISRYFEPGRELETYASPGELAEKVRYYLEHPEAREEIARRGQQRCLAEYAMDKLAFKMDELIKETLAAKGTPVPCPPCGKAPPAAQTGEITGNAIAATITEKGNETMTQGTAQQSVEEKVSSFIKESVEHLQAGRAIKAMRLAEQALGFGLYVPGLHYLYAVSLDQVGRHEEALEELQSELARNPGHKEAAAMAAHLTPLLVKPPRPEIPTEQRGYQTSLPRETLLEIQNTSHNYSYRGIPMIKNPFDFAIYPILIWDKKPRTIIEIGSKDGGSALWLGDMLDNFGIDGHVYSLDIVGVKKVSHPRVTFVEGDGRDLAESFSPEFILTLPRPLLVIEDADHSYETSSHVLSFFHRYLAEGETIIIEDGIISDLGMDPTYSSGPHRAIKEFLGLHGGDYQMEGRYCDFFGYNLTWCTNGFLKRTTPNREVADAHRSGSLVYPTPRTVPYPENHLLDKGLIREFMEDDPAPKGIQSQMSANERFQLYYALRKELAPQGPLLRFVEIGSYSGASLVLIHQALSRLGIQFQGICVEPGGTEQFHEVVKKLNGSVIHFPLFSHQAAERLSVMLEPGRLPEFMFIDGDHSYQGVKQDILDYFPLLAPGGIMLFHDYLPAMDDANRAAILSHHGNNEPGIRQAVEELMVETYRCQPIELPLLYPTDPTQTQPQLPIIPGVFSTVRAYRKPRQ
ncbi:glycosyltransferase [Geomonas sp. Red69]|uniref:Glycosyltransferase n=1 Tax=Geomonas diazotrophica TaxID=2843197 RepID=A0ABX8JF63_9BACT|nr:MULTISPECIES: CmcI family methyltransferase [Geomonas]MBU5638028.1 glycosyltransferase [Geomonas diazotrophica]QWV97030.1 glycosyltransferase [Geomonas nitrogeniifigens]